MIRLSKKIKNQILAHAQACYPSECCGVIVGRDYIPCTNLATEHNQFYIDPACIVYAESLGEITAIVHSHPDGSSVASEVDKAQMALHGLPWVIVGFSPNEPQGDFAVHKPKDYTAPLLGRGYFHGLQDCYSLVKDYYQRECGITLSDYPRDDLWWENKDNPSLYLDHFAQEGFVEIPLNELQKHDAILCRIGRTEHVNHACVFVGDGKLSSEVTPDVIGDSLILHHPYGRLSVREIYGEMWQSRTVKALRHKDFL